MAIGSDSKITRRRKVGTYLMLCFTIGWGVAAISTQFYMAYKLGYGSGFGDGHHMPANMAAKYGNDVRAAIAATAGTVPDMSVGEEVGRILFSLAVLTGIAYFWHSMMSRIGTF